MTRRGYRTDIQHFTKESGLCFGQKKLDSYMCAMCQQHVESKTIMSYLTSDLTFMFICIYVSVTSLTKCTETERAAEVTRNILKYKGGK